MAGSEWFPPEVVVVPRAVVKGWSDIPPYSELVAAAERGENGMRMDTGNQYVRFVDKGASVFRPARFDERFAPDRALLYVRGW